MKQSLVKKSLPVTVLAILLVVNGAVAFAAPPQRSAGAPDRPSRIGEAVKKNPRGNVAALPQRNAGAPDRLSRIGEPVKKNPRGTVAVAPHRNTRPSYHIPRIGHHVREIPRGFIEISLGLDRFFYHSGAYYRREPRGYRVIPAPVGIVLSVLPPGFQIVIAGSSTYYWYGGVYYQQVPGGYMVVRDPLYVNPPPVTAAEGERVTVTANVLNVRSGPGLDQSILTRIQWGTVVVVRGHAEGWLFVDVPGGPSGWIMAVYTSRPPSPAKG